ncbi:MULTISPECIES: ATP-binding protein [Streptomyces]|uniref:ATP-binding protein n=1 Tax=Streptomyces TaxID=1883 RepID=UPI000684254B|nr:MULTISPECIES: ATP-binding protein [Streptomyces]MBZ6114583.1 ATP-binding protein [Streptomyces olivaceus]MBZ6128428.1 ATP-binding protein [Streptomyces olivaceus]MBZ6149288.1 ATP-binding protein [Streptomyces olivaceus]MBZ6163192.1 ATP-binding protein [Streptomyces olivaceus]MBZ6190996.1 ATP-binding protein [Streptomyces olivaceus]
MSATTPQPPAALRTFTQQFSSTRRGARLTRLLTYEQLRTWQMSPDITDRAEQIVAELAANAALHGRVQGRDFRLSLTHDLAAAGVLRIAVTDARGDVPPSPVTDSFTPLHNESGRGLLIVAALADSWGTEPYPPGGKTVWAKVSHRSATAVPSRPTEFVTGALRNAPQVSSR